LTVLFLLEVAFILALAFVADKILWWIWFYE